MDLEAYKDKVVNVIGFSRNDFVGRLTESPHGPAYIRIEDPCLLIAEPDGKGVRIIKMGGTYNEYEQFVDLPFPTDMRYEIRVVRDGSTFHETYLKEATQEMPEHILAPGMADVIKLGRKRPN